MPSERRPVRVNGSSLLPTISRVMLYLQRDLWPILFANTDK